MRAIKRNQFAKSDFTPVFRHFVNVLINRVVADNLPEEIDQKFLLYHVLLYGRVLFFKKNGKYHVMWFSGKGERNEYYIQKEFLIVNPWAEETTGDYDEKDAGILYSDINAYIENCDVGLYDFVHDYSEIINSIDSSIRALAKNSKVIAFLTGSTTSFVNSAKQTIKQLVNSEDCIGVLEESLVDSIRVNPISEKMDYKFSELIKARQYYISDFYQKIGVSANMNMKAERLTDNESQLIDSVSDIDFRHIIDNLNFSVGFINEKFGLNISFRLNEKEEDEVADNSEMESEDNSNGRENENEANRTGEERTETSDSETRISGSDGHSSSGIGNNSKENSEQDNRDGIIDASGESGESNSKETELSTEDNGVTVNVEINIDTNGEGTDDSSSDDDSNEKDNESDERVADNSSEEEGVTKYTNERG